MVRTPFYDKNGVKKGAWSKEEDQKLRDYIHKYGHWNWRELPKFAGLSRCGKSCRLRWVNYLQPNLKRGNYSPQEEDTILKLHRQMGGNKWSRIAAQLPGRTDNEIKNYWHTHLKNRAKKNRKATDKSNQTFEYQGIQSTESEAESMERAPIPPHQIQESSIETSYHQILESSETSSYVNVSETKWVSEEMIATTSYAQPTGDFWTEPFVSDSSDFPDEYPLAYMEASPYVPYNGDWVDTIDLLYQVMRELPDNSAYLQP